TAAPPARRNPRRPGSMSHTWDPGAHHGASTDSTRSRSNRQVDVSQINRSFLRNRHMKSLIVRFVREDAGQDLIEYGLLVGIITLACIVSIKAIGPKVAKYYSDLLGN